MDSDRIWTHGIRTRTRTRTRDFEFWWTLTWTRSLRTRTRTRTRESGNSPNTVKNIIKLVAYMGSGYMESD